MKRWDEDLKRLQRSLSRPKHDDHCQDPIKMSTKEKIPKYDLSTLNKVTHPTIGSILQSQNQIAVILADFLCDAT